jgi:hypothetical protein
MTTDSASRRALLRLARRSIVTAVGGNGGIPFDDSLPILDRRGAFVTLTSARLRMHRRVTRRRCACSFPTSRVRPHSPTRASRS